jgi:hypothetical protein
LAIFSIAVIVFCSWNIITGIAYLMRHWRLMPVFMFPARSKGSPRAFALMFGSCILLLGIFPLGGVPGRVLLLISIVAYGICALLKAEPPPLADHRKRHFYWD